MSSVVTIEKPAENAQVVSLNLAKQNSNIDHDAQNDLMQLYLDAAVEDAENYTSLRLKTRVATFDFEAWQRVYIIDVNPLSAITSIQYVDKDGNPQTVSEEDYKLVSNNLDTKQIIVLSMIVYPELSTTLSHPIKISGVLGYTEETVPKAIQSAILLRFSSKELYREEMPTQRADTSFKAALRAYRKW